MTRSFSGTIRKANRLFGPARIGKTAGAVSSAVAGAMIKSALGPFVPLSGKKRTSATTRAGTTLGVVLKQLRLAQRVAPEFRIQGGTRPTVPDGARYLDRTHRTATGSRKYKIYLPSSQPEQVKGLILMLHGCKQTSDDFALGTNMNAHAEKHGLAIVYPAQGARYNSAFCWNWYKPENQLRGKGEPAFLASLTRKLMREHSLGRDEVFVAGLSAGGAMASILIDVYPDIFAAAGIHSGLARGSARNVLSAMSAMRNGSSTSGLAEGSVPARRIVFHGDNDGTVHPANAESIVATAMGDGATPTKVTRRSVRGRDYVRSDFACKDGVIQLELWMLKGGGHAWSGGRSAGTYTDASGPDASAQMVRFFLEKS